MTETTPEPQEKKLRPAPTKSPTNFREALEVLCYAEYYEGETVDEFNSRMNLAKSFIEKATAEGFTPDELAAAEVGIKSKPGLPVGGTRIIKQ